MFNGQCSMFNDLHHGFSSRTKNGCDDITNDLKDRSNGFTHNFFNVLNGE